MKKVIVLFVCFFLTLSLIGCGKSKEFSFRDIPLGTKYNEAIKSIKKDLNSIGINGRLDILKKLIYFSVYGDDKVDVAGYPMTLDMKFFIPGLLEINNDNINDVIFGSANYNYYLEKKNNDIETVFNDIKEKLTKLYGTPATNEDAEISWISQTGKTIISLTIEKSEYPKQGERYIKIYYGFTDKTIYRSAESNTDKIEVVDNTNNFNGL